MPFYSATSRILAKVFRKDYRHIEFTKHFPSFAYRSHDKYRALNMNKFDKSWCKIPIQEFARKPRASRVETNSDEYLNNRGMFQVYGII